MCPPGRSVLHQLRLRGRSLRPNPRVVVASRPRSHACADAALLAELRERLVDPRGPRVVAERDEEVRRLDVAAQVELAVDCRMALAGGAREALREEIHSTDARGVVDD